MSSATTASASSQTKSEPAWWTHAVIYEIYIRSFQDSNGDGVGDLNGITQRLDYLKELGVDAIWITPFFPSPNADFGYDVSDYTNVAAEYGTMADWDELVKQAKRRNIRILVDFVLNHTSDQHPWFKESRSSRTNPKRDWYVWKDADAKGGPPTNWQSIFGGSTWVLDPKTSQYAYHIFLPEQPDVNWANPDLRNAMFNVARFWMKRGASGFRLDATPYLFEDQNYPNDPDPKSGAPVWLKPYNAQQPENNAVLRDLRHILDTTPGGNILLGESATAKIEDLAKVYGAHHDEINLPMDFLFANQPKLNATAFKTAVDEAESKLNGQPPVFFLSSHDRSRQYSQYGDGVHNDQIAKLTAALLLAQRGTILLYAGEEIGMGDMAQTELDRAPLSPKRPKADNRDMARTPMQWTAGAGAGFTSGTPWLPIQNSSATVNVATEAHDKGSILNWYRALSTLRHDNPVFREGIYVPLQSGNPNVFAFARTLAGKGALVVLNMAGKSAAVRISGWHNRTPIIRHTIMASPSAEAPRSGDFVIAPYGVLITELTYR